MNSKKLLAFPAVFSLLLGALVSPATASGGVSLEVFLNGQVTRTGSATAPAGYTENTSASGWFACSQPLAGPADLTRVISGQASVTQFDGDAFSNFRSFTSAARSGANDATPPVCRRLYNSSNSTPTTLLATEPWIVADSAALYIWDGSSVAVPYIGTSQLYGSSVIPTSDIYAYVTHVTAYEKTGSPNIVQLSNSVSYIWPSVSTGSVNRNGGTVSINQAPEYKRARAFERAFSGWVACDAVVSRTIAYSGAVSVTVNGGRLYGYEITQPNSPNLTCRVFDQLQNPSTSINLLSSDIWGGSGTTFTPYNVSGVVASYSNIAFVSAYYLRDAINTGLTTGNLVLFQSTSTAYTLSQQGGGGGGGGGGTIAVTATTATQLNHTNPPTVGAGAILQGTPASWTNYVWSNPVTHTWQYKSGCTGGGWRPFATTSGGAPAGGLSLTVPSTIWVDPSSGNSSFTSQISTNGLVFAVDTFGSNSTHYSGSLSRGFLVGTGFCASGGNAPGGAGASPARYSGPEFSSFGSATLAGNKLVTSGKKLDTITSMKINGAAVTYKINSASELEIDLPKDLAPGKYDVEINSIHGKLTHLQGVTIKAVVPTKELAFKAEGAWLNYGSLLELTNVAKQIGSEYTSVKCVANAADPVVAERLAKRACSYIEANRLRGKAVTYESKSTYKGEGFWVRVVANG